jgi:hypothetical protein
VEPGCEVLDERESRLGVSLFDSQDEFLHPSAGMIMLLFMPAYRAVSGRPHEPFFVRKMIGKASDQALGTLTNFQSRAVARKDHPEAGECLKDFLVFVIDFRDEHGMRCAPFQSTRVHKLVFYDI